MPWISWSTAVIADALRRQKRPLLSKAEAFLKFCFSYRLANPSAQEAAIVVYPYLTAGQKVGHCSDHFSAALSARADGKDQVSKRRSTARSNDLAKMSSSFHLFSVTQSRCNAIPNCEYLFHRRRHAYSVFIHFRTDHQVTLLFNFITAGSLRCPMDYELATALLRARRRST